MFPICVCDFFYAKCISLESFASVYLGNNPFDSKPRELVWSQTETFVILFVHPSHRRYSQQKYRKLQLLLKLENDVIRL